MKTEDVSQGLLFQIKKLAKHGAIYGLGTVSSRMVGFFLIPLYTNFLTPGDYGILQLVYLTTEMLGIVIGLRISATVFRFYYEADNRFEQNKVIGTALLGVIFTATSFLIPIFYFSTLLSKMILTETSKSVLLRMGIISLWLQLPMNVVFSFIQVKEKSITYVIISLSRLISMVLLNVYFVAIQRIGVFGILLSSVMVDAMSFVILIPILFKEVGYHFSGLWLMKMLRFSLPMVPSSIANEVIHVSDRYFISAFFSLYETGVYAFAYKMGNSIHSFFYVAFSQIWNPRRFAIEKENDAPIIYSRICTYFMGLISFVALGMSLYSKEIVRFISNKGYWQAGEIMPMILLCYVIYALEDHLSTGIYLRKKTERYSLVKMVSGGVNIGLNFLLIPKYGMYGAVWATLITFVILNIGLFLFSRNIYPIPFEWGRLSAIFLVGILLYVVSTHISSSNLSLILFLKWCLWTSYPIILWFSKVIREEEKSELTNYLIKAGNRMLRRRYQEI